MMHQHLVPAFRLGFVGLSLMSFGMMPGIADAAPPLEFVAEATDQPASLSFQKKGKRISRLWVSSEDNYLDFKCNLFTESPMVLASYLETAVKNATVEGQPSGWVLDIAERRVQPTDDLLTLAMAKYCDLGIYTSPGAVRIHLQPVSQQEKVFNITVEDAATAARLYRSGP